MPLEKSHPKGSNQGTNGGRRQKIRGPGGRPCVTQREGQSPTLLCLLVTPAFQQLKRTNTLPRYRLAADPGSEEETLRAGAGAPPASSCLLVSKVSGAPSRCANTRGAEGRASTHPRFLYKSHFRETQVSLKENKISY